MLDQVVKCIKLLMVLTMSLLLLFHWSRLHKEINYIQSTSDVKSSDVKPLAINHNGDFFTQNSSSHLSTIVNLKSNNVAIEKSQRMRILLLQHKSNDSTNSPSAFDETIENQKE